MKKALAILLTLLMLGTAACASAQSAAELASIQGQFDIVLIYQEPLTLTQDEAPAGYVYFTAERQGLAPVYVSIAPSELADGLSMADLGEEGQKILTAMASSQYQNPVTETRTTQAGNLYLYVRSGDASDIVTLFTLYKGYFVQLTQFKDDFSALANGDEAFCLEVLQGIEFIDQ